MQPTQLLVSSAALLIVSRVLMPRSAVGSEIRGYRALLWALNRLFCTLWHGLDEPVSTALPESGPAIVIANHTSGLDPSLLQATSRRVLGFLIAREFYEHPVFHPICRVLGCIPVRRDGHDLAATRASLRALEQGRVVPIFPEGRINPTSGRTLLEFKPGAAFIVLHAGVPVVPAFIWGTPPTNHVVSALVTPSRSHIIYGEPLDPSAFAPDGIIDRNRLAAVSERLSEAIRALQAKALRAPETSDPSTVQGDESHRRSRCVEEGARGLSGDRPAELRA